LHIRIFCLPLPMQTKTTTMSKRPVFLIREYKVTDHNGKEKVFHTYLEQPNVSVVDAANGIYLEFGEKVFNKNLRVYQYATDLSKYKNLHSFNEKFLPFFADVTEDIPAQYTFKPKTYKRCQLLTEKYGNYLQFLDHESGEVLRIAINSNSYVAVE
jgi:hypothetical protein